MTRFLAACGLFVSVGLAGCSGPGFGEDVPMLADRHRIQVSPTIQTLEIAPVAQGLTDESRAQLASFFAAYRDSGNGLLMVTAPDAARSSRIAAKTMGDIVDLASASGVTRDRLVMGAYVSEPGQPLPIKVSYVSYAAVAQSCDNNWTTDVSYSFDNLPPDNFGCATQQNLAAMVADPRDLIDPRAMDPADARRRDTVLDHYRKGENTATETDESASGQVSTVAAGGGE